MRLRIFYIKDNGGHRYTTIENFTGVVSHETVKVFTREHLHGELSSYEQIFPKKDEMKK